MSADLPADNDPTPLEEELADEALNDLARGIVSLTAHVPDNALTAEVLGTERSGHGVVIEFPGWSGLVLTIGYLITEAETIWVSTYTGETLPAHVVGYDQETGFGLVQLLGGGQLPSLPLGDSSGLALGSQLVLSGAEEAVRTEVVAIREFAGYWEYVLPDALFTRPAHPNWGGAALLDARGQLVGIGSLLVQSGNGGAERGINMCVPVNAIRPIIDDLLAYGRRNAPARPWLGWLVQDQPDQLVVSDVYDGCPAAEAGIRVGDVVTAVAGEPVTELAELFRRVWTSGPAGATVELSVERDGAPETLMVRSIDRAERLVGPVLH